MKRYLVQLTALSLLALATGCQKEQGEINNPQNNQSAAVNISIDGLSIDAASSRAVIADMPDFTKNGFKIAGYYTEGTAPVDLDPGKSGRFDDNIATATPNVFDYDGTGISTGESVIVPKLNKDGEYHVTLSQWGLSENSYLSYFAWASNVEAGVAEGTAANPIKSSTKHGDKKAPFIQVTSGSASASLNVDVVAAKSTDNSNDVVRSAIDLEFQHVMTKLKFNVKNSSSVDMTLTGAKILFEAGKVYRDAKYSFDGKLSPLGTWDTYTNTVAATYSVTLTNTNLVSQAAAVHLDELLIIPQALAAGAISVELTYTIPNGASTSTYIRTVPLKAKTYEQNTSYTYEIALNETTISINEGRIGAWIEAAGGLPNIVGARDPNVLLLLDAYDVPYPHTDGNQYWLDRSGWNRHCKLVGGVSYDPAEKCYKFDGSTTTYGELPAMPGTSSVTIDFVARSSKLDEKDDAQNVFRFELSDAKRVMNIHFNYVGGDSFYLDVGQTSSSAGYTRVSGGMPTNEAYRPFAMYRTAGSNSNLMLFRNLSHIYNTRTTAVPYQSIDLSSASIRQIGSQFQGAIKYLKIMNVAKFTMSDATSEKEFAVLKKRHKLPDETYVKRGLLFDIRGTDAPVGGKWVDRVSGLQSQQSVTSQYKAAQKEYDTASGGRIDFEMTPAIYNADFSKMNIEAVLYRPADGGIYNEFLFTNNISWGKNVDFAVLLRLRSPGGVYIDFTSPMVKDYNQNSMTWGYTEGYQATKRHYLLVNEMVGANRRLNIYTDNVVRQEQLFTSNVMPLPTQGMKYFKMGEQPGIKISATRLYNCTLSPVERNWNYALDKVTYNLP